MLVRAVFRAVTLPEAAVPYNHLLCKVYYPAAFHDTESERSTGQLPILERDMSYPIVIFFNGVNVEKSGYQWLAEQLAAAGYVVVLFDHVAELFGMPTLTAGIDLAAVQIGQYGTRPTSTTLPALLEALHVWNTQAPFNGQLDTQTIVLGGHSGGGTLALHNANPRWFAGVRGAFTYAAHTMASTRLGYPAGTILPVAPESAYLLIGGTADGVIAASSGRYGTTDAQDPILRTFHEGITGGRGDCYCVMLRDAGHFACVHPQDLTTGRQFLEEQPTNHIDYRAELGALVGAFLRQICSGGEGMTFLQLEGSIATFCRK